MHSDTATGGTAPGSSLFDLERIRRAGLVRELRFFRELESTNSTALELAREPATACPALVLTERQTAGRGRGRNRWWSDEGALTFSLLIEPGTQLERGHWPRIALAAAVSICRSLARCTPRQRYGIRWPNDVYAGEKKIAGILVEVPALPAECPGRLVVGMGINVNNSVRNAPADVRVRACALADLAASRFSLTEVLIDVMREFREDMIRLTAGSPGLARDWAELCQLRGRTVRLELGARQVRGLCRGIDSDGALLVEVGATTERFYGGVLTEVE